MSGIILWLDHAHPPTLNIWNISITSDWIFLKFQNEAWGNQKQNLKIAFNEDGLQFRMTSNY